jgi:hypothetical protein
MNGKVSLCNGAKVMSVTVLDETIKFEIREKMQITHLLVEVPGYKDVKYTNASMPLNAKEGDTIKITNFLTYLMKANALMRKSILCLPLIIGI